MAFKPRLTTSSAYPARVLQLTGQGRVYSFLYYNLENQFYQTIH